MLCMIVGSLSKFGQGVASVLVAEELTRGPVQNFVDNVQLVAEYIACNLELQTRIQYNRITLAAGPLEALLEKYFGEIFYEM